MWFSISLFFAYSIMLFFPQSQSGFHPVILFPSLSIPHQLLLYIHLSIFSCLAWEDEWTCTSVFSLTRPTVAVVKYFSASDALTKQHPLIWRVCIPGQNHCGLRSSMQLRKTNVRGSKASFLPDSPNTFLPDGRQIEFVTNSSASWPNRIPSPRLCCVLFRTYTKHSS